MELIIELVGRGGRHFDLQKVAAEHISIGRAFDNDIVLADPHVCAHHAMIETNANGTVQIRDLDSINGTYTKDHQAIDAGYEFSSGDEFIVGKTHIRIYQSDHAVPASIRLNWIENLAQFVGSPPFAGAVFGLALLFGLFFQYSAALKGFNIGRELISVVGALLLISFWPAGWSMFARIRKHDARFMAQFSATLIFFMLATLLQKLINWLAYHTGTNLGLDLLGNGVYILLALVLIWFNYYLSIFQSARQRWIYAVSFTGVLAGFAYITSTFDADRFEKRPSYNAGLYPPSLTVYSAQPVEVYLKKAEGIFEKSRALIDDGK